MSRNSGARGTVITIQSTARTSLGSIDLDQSKGWCSGATIVEPTKVLRRHLSARSILRSWDHELLCWHAGGTGLKREPTHN
jgi:hypothetical protein